MSEEVAERYERRHGELDKRIRDVEKTIGDLRPANSWSRWTNTIIVVLQIAGLFWMQAISTRLLDMRDDGRAEKKDEVEKIVALAVWKSGIERDLREIKKTVKPES